MLAQRTDELASEVLRNGRADAKKIQEVEALERLLKVYLAARLERPLRWPLPAALLGILTLVSVSMVMRVRETAVVLRLEADEVCFTSAREQPLVNSLTVTSLGLSGLNRVVLPRTRRTPSPRALETDFIHLAVDAADPSSSLTLVMPPVAAGRRVCLRYPTGPSQLRLSIAGALPEIRTDSRGTVRIAAAGDVESLDLPSPQPVLLQPGRGDVDLDLELPSPLRPVINTPLDVEAVSLSRIEDAFSSGSDRTTVRRVSALRSGTIAFQSLDGVERSLRPGEVLSFGDVRADVTILRLKDDCLEMELVGRVRDLAAGGTEHRRSLMPTWVEWIRARHGVSLLWGSVVYVFGLVLLVLRWLRVNL